MNELAATLVNICCDVALKIVHDLSNMNMILKIMIILPTVLYPPSWESWGGNVILM